MQDLIKLKTLQSNYQEKFAVVLKLQEELGISGSETTDSPEYLVAKEEWLKAGNELKLHLEQYQ
ncbi:hypothetical protein ACFSJU_12580 [Paradesertivirga mongoliensis]|uniref:Uncharacterized protein n=1 Tax=Paradesertivirga mongoliensis TaxID=2100740 RepID=A0ABW4ZMK6_9SPHI|nr:hypothetical protein [Pedobacter mongoliensis]